ncbi:hypothetical protein MKW98_026222 [Papaver atlanticum]|uniref:FCP1 homology domain-containing protein n=1 Tax=Papaver atlanticum TaxID=357466 RepID=A0AAD4T3C1_9MAGN|nr:hypothetical protein MKW98_026222 [Papaver atlanticum]
MSYLEAVASTESTRTRCDQPHKTASRTPTSSSNSPNKIQEKKTLLVLDLDETLVHRTISTGSLNKQCDFSFTIGERTCYVLLRPYVRKFLERVSELFDVAIFTASGRGYADPTLDFLDPQHKLIARRYYKDSAVYRVDGSYYKDLSIFGIDLAKVILVDDCPTNFCMQKDNGIPIASWYTDPQDDELSTLLPFLERLAAADDVRPIIAERLSQLRRIYWLKDLASKQKQQEGNTEAKLNSGD